MYGVLLHICTHPICHIKPGNNIQSYIKYCIAICTENKNKHSFYVHFTKQQHKQKIR